VPRGRLPVFKHPQVERVLRRNGFRPTGGKGSHRKYEKGSLKITVPCHARKDIPPGTLNNIITRSGKSRDEFA